jgi:RHS repeat-associated protein
VVDPQAEILLEQAFSPYGEVLSSIGDYHTAFSYTPYFVLGQAGEMTDGSGLVNLRARYYDPGTGRFVSKDIWAGNNERPLSLNKWNYVEGNPVNFLDQTGYYLWRWSSDPLYL